MLKEIWRSSFEVSIGNVGLIITALFLVALCCTRIYTTVAFYCAASGLGSPSTTGAVPSPLLPYSIPFIGHSLRFLEKNATRWYHRQRINPPNGIYSIMVGGRKTHIITNPSAIRHLFRHAYSHGLSRETFVKDLLVKCLSVSPQDTSIINTGEGRKQQEEVFHKYLARRTVVDELTSTFSMKLHQKMSGQKETMGNIKLYAWLRRTIISTSLTTFFGEELVRLYPELCDDIFCFDEDLCTFFFGFPRILNRDAWARRQRILDNLESWDTMIHKLNSGPPDDPANCAPWDPVFGSRFNKARMLLYDDLKLSMQSRAGMNLSIMFALASNVVPAIGWMLFHIIAGPDSPCLLRSVREEVDMATKSDGALDASQLLSASPILQSIWTEVLRHYCDNMIMRDVVEDTIMPLDDQGLKWVNVEKGDTVISPCWVSHHEPAYWQDDAFEPSPDIFAADRFSKKHVAVAKANALAGVPTAKMYPFGGGKSICGGRIFAKEEAIIAVAQMLSSFDIVVHGFLDGNDKPTGKFPGLKPSLPGVVIYAPEGDLSITIKKRVAQA